MKSLLVLLFLVTTYTSAFKNDAQLPTLYEHYTSGGIRAGLNASNPDGQFTLNGKPITLLGGSYHYFRAVPEHWRPTLLKMKAAGLNVVDFYMPWNLHEENEGHFDYTSGRLHLAAFLEEVKRADMFASARPGPYICGEFEMGGLPGWLLKDEHMQLRYNYTPYMNAAERYWNKSLEILTKYQFSTSGSGTDGGPIIMLQLENEYYSSFMPTSVEYVRRLRELALVKGFKGLFFMSDTGGQDYPIKGLFPENDVLETANLGSNSDTVKALAQLRERQTGRAALVSEFWTGIQGKFLKRLTFDLFLIF